MTFILSALLCFASAGGNYPDRADYLWVTVPDHPDWLYKTGESAKVEIQFYKYGIPRDCTVEYKLADDMLPADKNGSISLKGGRGTLNMGTRKTPGFRDLQLSTVVDGVKYEHHIKLGFSVDRIQPFTREPGDFVQFWQDNVRKAEEFPLTYTKELAPEYCTDKIDCYLVRLMLNPSQSIYGYLFYPKNAVKGGCPVVLCPPGAGIKTIKQPLRHKYYAEPGRTGGYPHFNRIPGFFTKEIIDNLAYYDVVNFARHIKAKVYMTWGYNDNTCPPTTSYAVWNVLTCPKEALITPVNEHWTSEATERGHLDWMLKNIK